MKILYWLMKVGKIGVFEKWKVGYVDDIYDCDFNFISKCNFLWVLLWICDWNVVFDWDGCCFIVCMIILLVVRDND